MKYAYLLIAILTETMATTLIKSTNGFANIIPTIIVILGYMVSFFFLSLTIKFMPVGIVYAIWSGLGIVLVSIASYFYYKQSLDLFAIIGMVFIILGVAIINLLSNSTSV